MVSCLLLVLEDFKSFWLESRGYDTVTDLCLQNLSQENKVSSQYSDLRASTYSYNSRTSLK